jgi:type III secretion protein O
MVRVRRHREEKASEGVAKARRVLDEARRLREKAQKALVEYAAWRVQEERRKLDGLMRRMLRLGELSDVRLEITALREREFTLVDAVKQAEAAVTAAEAALDEARRRHAEAVRELEKLIEHRSLWQTEVSREQQRIEDLELEEFSRPSRFASDDTRHERN